MRIANHDCKLCPRLVSYREENRAAFPDWHNGPVQSFGDITSELLILGLAPGVRGANKTGRPFTGDFAGDLLYLTLSAYGFSSGTYDSSLMMALSLLIVGLPMQFVASLRKTNRSGQKSRPVPPF